MSFEAADERDGDRDRILVVCSANQCRSPLVAALLEARLRERGAHVIVESRGMQAVEGAPATQSTRDAARPLRIDLSAHRSRRVIVDDARASELVVAMERRHVREIVVLEPTAFARTFTLKDLVRRGSQIGPRTLDEPIQDWLARAHEGRRGVDLLGAAWNDDVADPTTDLRIDHRAMAAEVDALTRELVDLAWPVIAD